MSISSDHSNEGGEEVHRGHDLETGILLRVREWTDVFPWLRLVRTLRVAGSPPLVLLTAIVFSIWWFGDAQIIGPDRPRDAMRLQETSLDRLVGQSGEMIAGHVQRSIPTSMFAPGRGRPWRQHLLRIVWSLLIWVPIAMLLARQGALLTAGRSMVGLKPGISHVIRRSPAAWLAAAVPLACVLAIGLLIAGAGWLARWMDGIWGLEVMLAIMAALIAIPCGMLAFGASVAVPIAWAALVNERDPDALDSLSRGYEYLFRRPLQLVLYAALSLGILSIIGALASQVAWAAASVAFAMLNLSGCSPTVRQLTLQFLQLFPAVVVLTLLWSLVGGVYLLLRYDAGEQEVEDLWQPSPEATPSLPEIPTSYAYCKDHRLMDNRDNLDNAKLETVAERSSEVAATVLVSVLRDAGIRAVATGGFTAGFRAEAPGIVRVQTLERDAQRAREIIAQIKLESPDE